MPSLAPSQCAKITVPTNNSPFPRDPHTCSLSHPQSPKTRLSCARLQSSLILHLCTQTCTFLPVTPLTHLHVHKYFTQGGRTHKCRHTDTCRHTPICIFSDKYTYTCETPFDTPLPTHVYTQTHKWWGGWLGHTTSNPEAISGTWRRSREEGPLSPGPHSSQPYGLSPQRALWLLEAFPGPRVGLLPTSLTPWPFYSTLEHSMSSSMTGSYFHRGMDMGPPKTGISQLSIPVHRLGEIFLLVDMNMVHSPSEC